MNNEQGSVKDLEEVVEASFVKMIDDLKRDVEAPCVEIDDLKRNVQAPCVEIVEYLEEIVKTTCMEDVGSKIECLEVIDSHSRYKVGLQVAQSRKRELVKVDFVLEKST